MEIITTVRDFSEQMHYHSIPADTHIRVIIEDQRQNTKVSPAINHHRQKEIPGCTPSEYEPATSMELTPPIKKKSMRGCLQNYADSRLISEEKDAWVNAVVEKYGHN